MADGIVAKLANLDKQWIGVVWKAKGLAQIVHGILLVTVQPVQPGVIGVPYGE